MSVTRARYDGVAIFLHWLIAAAIIVNIALGLYFGDLPRSDPNKFLLVQTHKSIGFTVLVLSLVRLGWRLSHPVPALPDDMHPLLQLAARTTHVLLYVLMIAIPFTGWALVSSSPLGLPSLYFGWFPWPDLPILGELPRAMKKPLSHDFGEVHVLLAWSMIALIPVHVIGALYHQFVRRDDVMSHMVPGLGAPQAPTKEA